MSCKQVMFGLLILMMLGACAAVERVDYVVSDNSREIDRRYPQYIGHWACSGDLYDISIAPLMPDLCDRIARATLECREFGTNCEYASRFK